MIEPLKVYLVTKSSSDRTFQKGDLIWLSQNGQMNFIKEKGWLEEKEWTSPETSDFEFVIQTDYIVEGRFGREIAHPYYL